MDCLELSVRVLRLSPCTRYRGSTLRVLAGLVVLVWPGISALVTLHVIAFWTILGGVLRIVAAISLRPEIENEWMMGLSGAPSVVLGVLLAFMPGVGLLSLVWLIGIFALGAALIGLAFKVRGHRSAGSGRVH